MSKKWVIVFDMSNIINKRIKMVCLKNKNKKGEIFHDIKSSTR